jgi:hypothetical protein
MKILPGVGSHAGREAADKRAGSDRTLCFGRCS